MKTTYDNKVRMDNYGTSNYSCGLEAVIFDPRTISWEDVQKRPGIFLHPVVKATSQEIFALKGTKKQFDQFYQDVLRTHCTKKALDKIGMPITIKQANKLGIYIDLLKDEFQPWYEHAANKVE